MELTAFEIYEQDFLFVIFFGNSVCGMKCHNTRMKGEDCHRSSKVSKDHFISILNFASFVIKRFISSLVIFDPIQEDDLSQYLFFRMPIKNGS